MSQSVPQTLIRTAIKFKSHSFTIPLTLQRHYSSSTKAEIIEIDLSGSCSTSIDGPEVARKLEEVMHRLLVQRSTPDWILFIPGSSFWVPPTRRSNSESSPAGPVLDLLGKLSYPLSAEEQLSLTSARGWPSSAYFASGGTYTHPVDIDANGVRKVETGMKVKKAVGSLPKSNEDVGENVPIDKERSKSENENE